MSLGGLVWLLLFWGLVGCAPETLPPLGLPDAELRVEAAARKVGSGEPAIVVVRLTAAPDQEVRAPAPAADGLVSELVGEREERVGEHHVVERTYRLAGPDGSYVVVVQPATVRHADGREEPIETSPVFLDIGTDGPTSRLSDIAVPAEPDKSRWPWIVAALLAVLGVGCGVGVWLHRRRRRAASLRRAEPPDVAAMRAWDDALRDPSLDDHDRALRLSGVFRTYLEARYGWKATAFTSREITDALYQDGVPAALLDRVRRILAPMDLLKYARQGGGGSFFQSLDEDFRVVLQATGPRVPGTGETPGGSRP